MSEHQVRDNECIITIAAEHGVSVSDIKDHAGNQTLLQERRLLNCLAVGDRVAVPTQSSGQSLSLETVNRLQLAEDRFLLPLTFRDEQSKPVSGLTVRFSWTDDQGTGHIDEATTDGNGTARFELPLDCENGVMEYERGDDQTRVRQPVSLGRLDPPETPAGMLQRIRRLGMRPLDRTASHTPEDILEAYADELGMDVDTIKDALAGDASL
ncbi:Ig-like domain-containing protein [Saccharospirillum salsuginis]|uniref:LysM domain-containing protein n=1 Tax=Saccharospirillum salsuginis TaxID=418750 RepID=A0A918KDI7_9GAMM|nr:Ig-like domain-containing protein [Saccharospirillum salsuginis]GGX59523.1 hypothetical protein GCM10007392_29330 [Saccharospirillum salsuginis]